MTLPYLQKPIDVVSVTSYEALRAMPTWRAEENVLAFLLQLREKTVKNCVVQTRSEADGLLKIAAKGRIDQFYDEEIEMREMVKYPPYTHFILMTYSGTREQLTETESEIESMFTQHKLQSYNTPLLYKGNHTRHTLIRIPTEQWPDEQLMERLRSLSPTIKIEVNPDRIV